LFFFPWYHKTKPEKVWAFFRNHDNWSGHFDFHNAL
jgi:hypothetical protein